MSVETVEVLPGEVLSSVKSAPTRRRWHEIMLFYHDAQDENVKSGNIEEGSVYTPVRDARGRWPKGVSGNPGGYPRRLRNLAQLCVLEDENNLATLCEIRDDVTEPGMVRIAAARTILEYAHGRPPPMTTIAGLPDRPQVIVHVAGVDATL